MKNKRGSFNTAIAAMAKYSMVASHANLTAMNSQHVDNLPNRTPYLSKLEAIASSAVRAADKVRQGEGELLGSIRGWLGGVSSCVASWRAYGR